MDQKKSYLLPAILAGICIVFAIVILIVANVLSGKDEIGGIREILLVEPDGTEHSFSADKHVDEAKMLANLLLLADETTIRVSSVNVPNYNITYTYADRTEKYSLCAIDTEGIYFVYLTADDGKIYRAPRELGLSFLLSVYGENAYVSAEPPVLFTSAEDSVTPSSMEWFFLGADGTYRQKTKLQTTSKNLNYYQNGYVGFRFSISPDSVDITIHDESKILFHGTLEELASSDLSNSGKLEVRIMAQWQKKDNASYYGQAEYAFSLEYVAPAVFTPASASGYQGGFLFIRCENILDPSKIKAQMMNDNTCTVRFYSHNRQTIGVITISKNSVPGNKTIRFVYGGITTNITFTVMKPEHAVKTVSYSLPSEKLPCFSSSAQNDFHHLYLSLCDENTDYPFLSESFLFPVNGGTEIVGFGDILSPAGSSETLTTKYAEYSVVAGTAVTAMNSGTVCATGYDTFWGNYVVISHGCGVQTWYGHLSGISVKSGDTVTRGSIIGTAGNSGCSAANNVAILASVCGQPVDPQWLINNGTPFIKYNYR